MGTRITLAFLAVLVVALVLAGSVSYVLVHNAAAQTSRKLVLQQAQALARSVSTLSKTTHDSQQIFAEILPLISSIAGIEEASIVEVSGNGSFVSAVPALDINRTALDWRTLGSGRATSGVNRQIAFAAVPLFSVPQAAPGGTTLVVALFLARLVSNSAASVSYFLLAGAIALLATALAAGVISRRISRRVVAAAGAAEQIASGDLSTRLAASRNDDAELAILRTSINQMAERLEDLRDLDRQFLLAVSHDLRTPLTSILGYAEAIAEGQVTDARRAAQVVVGEANRLERLIGDLLDLARLEAHQFSLNTHDIDAAECVASTLESLRYGFEAAGIELVNTSNGPAPLVADRDRLAQIVANLTENALRFASHRVEVGCAVARPTTVEISVTDDGPGIDEEDRPHIFERHFTSSKRPGRSAGTGLGLAIVAELVEAMRGEVTVTSPVADGHGTRVSIILPNGRRRTPLRRRSVAIQGEG